MSRLSSINRRGKAGPSTRIALGRPALPLQHVLRAALQPRACITVLELQMLHLEGLATAAEQRTRQHSLGISDRLLAKAHVRACWGVMLVWLQASIPQATRRPAECLLNL